MSSFFSRSKSDSGNLNGLSQSNSNSTLSGRNAQATGSDDLGDINSRPSTPNGSPQKELRTPGSVGRKGGSAFMGMRSRTSSQTSLKSLKGNNSKDSPTGVSTPRKAGGSSTGSAMGSSVDAIAENAEELPSDLRGREWKPRPGHPGNLSSEQTTALLSLTGRLSQDETLPDQSLFTAEQLEVPLCRFLRARSWNVDAAREMWNKSVAWKKEVNLDRQLSEFDFAERDAVAKAGWQMYFHKTDKLGRPIFVQDLANLDTNALWAATTPERIIMKFATTLETAVRYRYHYCTVSDPEGRLIEDNLMILDVNGLGMTTFWNFRGQLQQLLSILDTNFPELSGRVQIINAPWLFSTIWGYIKGWLPPATVDKIDIQGSDYKNTLLKFVEPQDLPKQMGGTCQCAQGCALSDEGPWKGRMQLDKPKNGPSLEG
ncbi:unnamed protein product [Sympodiomycopsis kandeliae]